MTSTEFKIKHSELIEQFRSAFDNVRVIGDANAGGRIAMAIRQGFEAGYTFG